MTNKFIFFGKDKPLSLENDEDNEDILNFNEQDYLGKLQDDNQQIVKRNYSSEEDTKNKRKKATRVIVEKKIDENVSQLINLNLKEYYRFVVDGNLHKDEDGWMGYSKREAGSVTSLLTSLSKAFEAEGGITPDQIKSIHFNVISVPKYNPLCSNTLRSDAGGYHFIMDDNLSKQGFMELFKKKPQAIKFYESEGYINNVKEIESYPLINLPIDVNEAWEFLRKKTKEGYKIFFFAADASTIKKEIKTICKNYNKEITKSPLTSREKISIIVKAVQAINQIHPYVDANIRTCLVCLQKLLWENDMLPTMLADPNIFDGFSHEEIVTLVEEGIIRTQNLIEHPNAELFEFKSFERQNYNEKYEGLDWHMRDVFNAEDNLYTTISNHYRPTSRLSPG